MSIAIPICTPDWKKFYNTATKEGLKVGSRYRGVHIRKVSNTIRFTASFHSKTGKIHLGNFPLTKEGEEQAFDAYVKYIDSIPVKERSAWLCRRIPGKLMQKL